MLSLEYFHINFGDINTFRQSSEWERRRRTQGAEPRERLRDEHRKGRKRWVPRRRMAYTSERSPRRRTCYQMWKRNLKNSVLFTSTMISNGVMPAPSCGACTHNVSLTKLTLSVVTAISHGIFVLKHTRLNELIHRERSPRTSQWTQHSGPF